MSFYSDPVWSNRRSSAGSFLSEMIIICRNPILCILKRPLELHSGNQPCLQINIKANVFAAQLKLPRAGRHSPWDIAIARIAGHGALAL